MSKTELQLVSLEQSRRLRALGWNGVFVPPTALALKWMRDEHDMKYIMQDSDDLWWWYVRLPGCPIDRDHLDFEMSSHTKTYEEAESAVLDALLTYLEKGEQHED